MQVTCKQCGAPIGAEAVNLDRLVAKCAFCNAVFSFADQLEPAERPRPAAERFDVPMPKGFDVQARTGRLRIARKWFSHKNSTSTTYEVYAILQDGARQKLLSGLHEIEQALYIEQEIERFLEIEDRPVRGETAR
jgi:hypothetical protein